jgi:hypothetical protein
VGSFPKPLSALRMVTTGDECGRIFWGTNGIITKSLASTAVVELNELVARHSAAILRLLIHLANLGGGAAPAAIAASASGSAPAAALAHPAPPGTATPAADDCCIRSGARGAPAAAAAPALPRAPSRRHDRLLVGGVALTQGPPASAGHRGGAAGPRYTVTVTARLLLTARQPRGGRAATHREPVHGLWFGSQRDSRGAHADGCTRGGCAE